jgi:uncharacterized protein YjbI with pentapeptide repeats
MEQMETKKIGNKITDARKKINISQAQLAQRLFISSQAVGKWERGESMPDIITLIRLAEIMGVDLNYFSENFQSVTNENASVDSLIKQPAELTSLGTMQTTTGKHPVRYRGNKHRWDMSRGNWMGADFSGLRNLHEKFSSSNMQRCLFISSDLSALLLKNNHVDGCNFSNSDISSSQIQNSYLNKNLFNDCSLQETEFSGSYIYGCNFTNADFTGVVVKSGGFEKNIIDHVVWNRTTFIDTIIADTVFEVSLDDCSFENCAFKKVTFRNVILTNTFFKNKNLKGVTFIDCQVDKLTYAFLKNGKADLTGITILTQ